MAKKHGVDAHAATGTADFEAPMAPGLETEETASTHVDESTYEETLLATLPEQERYLSGALLFAEACLVYGIDPHPEKKPAEILSDRASGSGRWRFYPGDEFAAPPVPDRVRCVTAGGVKICHPMDLDFEQILRRWFKAWHVDDKTKEVVEDPLPEDLTLPREAITGLVMKTDHVLRGGYLRARALEAAKQGVRR